MQRFKFKSPTTISVYAPPSSGKSYLTRQVLQHAQELFTKPPKRIVYCYKEWLEMFEEMQLSIPHLILHEGLPSRDKMEEWTTGEQFILVLDDLQQSVQRNQEAAELFTVGSHHKKCTIIYMCHNIFGRGPFAKLISTNTHYMILFHNNRDVQQVRTLGQQIFGSDNPYFLDAYKKATAEPYGYLVADLHPNSRGREGEYKLLTRILPGEDTIVYKPAKK